MRITEMNAKNCGRKVRIFVSERVKNEGCDDCRPHCGWWSDCNGKPLLGKVLRDTNMEKNYMGVLRDVFIETPNGIHEVFRLQERELNSGIYLTD